MTTKVPTSKVWHVLKPPLMLKPSEWCERHRVLTAEDSARPGKISFKGAFAYQKEIMDTCATHEKTIFMSSAQMGKTSMLLNLVAFFGSTDPGSILIVLPSSDQAQSFSRTRLAPMFQSTKVLTDLIDYSRRALVNNLFFKQFKNEASVAIVSALSPQSLRARPIRFCFLDEVSAYVPTEKEGDPCQLAEARTKSFHNRKIIYTSTPTTVDACRISSEFYTSDQRYFMLACLGCGFRQRLIFEQLAFNHDNPLGAQYKCEKCNHLHHHHDKKDMMEKGEWIATEKSRIAGFHISELYSPFRSWGELATQWLESKQREDCLQVFTNTVLGLPFKERLLAEIQPDLLLSERIKFPRLTLPEGVLVITGGIDIQKDRFIYELVGWNEQLQSYSILHGEVHCEIGTQEAARKIDIVRQKKFVLSSGMEIGISLMCIDAGYLSTWVYSYCRGKSKGQDGYGACIPTRGRRDYPTMLGASRPIDIFINTRKMHGGNMKAAGVNLFPVGVNVTKSYVMASLNKRPRKTGIKTEYPEGFCFFDEKRHDLRYFQELLSERLVTRVTRTGKKQYWTQIFSENHLWDCRVYATAAASGVGVFRMNKSQWDKLRLKLGYSEIYKNEKDSDTD